MAESYLPFDAGAGSSVTEAGWSDMARLWLPTGVVYNELNKLEAFGDSSGMQVKLRTGQAWIKGHWYENDAEQTLAVTAADPTNPRIDRVVIELDWVNNVIDAKVVAGTPAGSPSAPTLTQTTSVWQISVAQVAVAASDTTIEAASVTDERIMVAGHGGMTPLAHRVLSADASAFDITGIPPGFAHLLLVGQLRGTTAANNQTYHLRFNGDTGANYRRLHWAIGGDAVVVTGGLTGQTSATAGLMAAASATTAYSGVARILIPNYWRSTFQKTFRSDYFGDFQTYSSASLQQGAYTGGWASTAAINQVTLTATANNFLAGSCLTLYALSSLEL